MEVHNEYENEDYEDPYNNEVYENYYSDGEYTTYNKATGQKNLKNSQNKTKCWSKMVIAQIIGVSILAIGIYFKYINYFACKVSEH